MKSNQKTQKKRKNSHNKGYRGESEAAKFLTSLGLNAVRVNGLGVSDGRDVIIKGLPDVFLEVKRVESFTLGGKALEDAWGQAANKCWESGCPTDLAKKTACVLWRTNNHPWKLTYLDDKCGLVTVYRHADIVAGLKMMNEYGSVGDGGNGGNNIPAAGNAERTNGVLAGSDATVGQRAVPGQ